METLCIYHVHNKNTLYIKTILNSNFIIIKNIKKII